MIPSKSWNRWSQPEVKIFNSFLTTWELDSGRHPNGKTNMLFSHNKHIVLGEHFKLELWLSVGNFFYSEKGGYIRVHSGISTENRNSEIYLFIFFCKFSGGWIKHHHFWFKYTALGICVSLIIKTNECIYKFKQRFLIAFRDKIKTFKLDKKTRYDKIANNE